MKKNARSTIRNTPLALTIFASLLLSACASLSEREPKGSFKEQARGWKFLGSPSVQGIPANASSFDVRANVYLYKPMKSFFCQPYSPRRKLKTKKDDHQKRYDQIELGEKVYLKDEQRGVGRHTLTLSVNIVSKYTSERSIKWIPFCYGRIDKSAKVEAETATK